MLKKLSQKFLTLVLALSLFVSCGFINGRIFARAESAESVESEVGDTNLAKYEEVLSDEETYYAEGYKSRDCVLSANVYMLRRASIMKGSVVWSEIKNSTLRKTACTTSTGSSLRYSYTYTKDGLTFKVVHALLQGSANSKKAQLKKLLEEHPEGVVVRGKSTSGAGHGILVTQYRDGKFWAVDSAQNSLKANIGIVPISKTTVPYISNCSHIWYVDSISGYSVSGFKESKVKGFAIEKSDGKIRFSWSEPTAVKPDGYYIYKLTTGSEEFKSFLKVDGKSTEACFDESELMDVEKFMIRAFKYRGELRVFSSGREIENEILVSEIEEDGYSNIDWETNPDLYP